MNTTVTTNVVPSDDVVWRNILQQVRAVRFYYIWVLAAVGFPGNLACLLTVLSMPVTTATFYVALLAGADSFALLTKLISHQLYTYDALNAVACSLEYLPTLAGAYANWVLVLICFERFFGVCWPLKKHVYFTKKKCYISALVLGLLLLVLFIPTFAFTYEATPDGDACVPREAMSPYKDKFWDAGMTAALYFFAPFILVAIFVGITIAALQVHRRNRQNMRTSGSGSGAGDGNIELAISIMLVCAGLIFLALTLPMCLYHLVFQYQYSPKIFVDRVKDFLFYQIVTIMSETTHALNFLVYFVSATKFRASFRALLMRCPCIAKLCVPSTVSDFEDQTQITQLANDNRAGGDNPPSATAASSC